MQMNAHKGKTSSIIQPFKTKSAQGPIFSGLIILNIRRPYFTPFCSNNTHEFTSSRFLLNALLVVDYHLFKYFIQGYIIFDIRPYFQEHN